MLQLLRKMASELNVLEISKCVLDNPQFEFGSGSSNKYNHHYGTGGLVKHTLEVCELCLKTNKYFKNLNKGVNDSLLFLAALFHDVGKLWDYECINGVWGAAKHKKLIHHISRSGLVWNEAVLQNRDLLSQNEVDEVYHAILAHHGCREWGSPISPATRLAWILHLCDVLSARMDDCCLSKLN